MALDTNLPTRPGDARTHLGDRLATLVIVAGLLVTVTLYGIIYVQQAQGTSASALAMSDMGMENMQKYWAFPVLDATGLAALIFAWFSVFLGLQQSGRAIVWLRLDYKQVDRLHRYLSTLVITLVALHVVATMLDAMGDNWRTAFLFNQAGGVLGWPDANWAYNAGVIAMYVLAVTAPSFYLRRGIGAGRWRVLHRLVIVFYVLSLWHGLLIGADIAHYAWVRPLLWTLQIPLLALLIRRVARPARAGEAKRTGHTATAVRYTVVNVAALGIVAIACIVLSGNSDIIARV